jgi:predicted acetyltransferase
MSAQTSAEPIQGGTEVRFEPEGPDCKVSVVRSGEAVARLRVLRRSMHLAGAAVEMGGIADVVTHPAHRGLGYGARLLEATVAYMRRERYHFSVLFGIPDFYWRFGYAPVLPEYDLSVSTRDAERLVPAALATVRPAGPDDAPALLDLYTRRNTGRNGTLQRAPERFDARPRQDAENWWQHPRRLLLATVAGRPAGYAVLHGDPARFRVQEVIVPSDDVATAGAALVIALAEEAVRRRLERVRLPLPPDEPLAGLLRGAGCKMEITYPTNGGGMGRVVDLPSLAESLEPALAPRVAALPESLRPGTVDLDCGEEGRASLSFGGGRTVRLTFPQPRLSQLLMGYRGVDDLRTLHPDAVDPEDLPVVRALFPAGYPHMWAIDHF